MSESITLRPDTKKGHQCVLPWKRGGYGMTGEPEGALHRCTCGRWYWCAPCFESFGPVTEWRRVRWYHRRFLRRIVEHELVRTR